MIVLFILLYQRDLRKKLQRLEQGNMLIQDYYVEL